MVDSRNWFEKLPETRQRKLLASQRDALIIEIEGKRLLNFASNDYLGLSHDPQVKAAVQQSIVKDGLGSGASRLVSGDAPEFHVFEQALADWKGFEACLLVGSGMLANIGLLQALADRHTHIYADKLNHASLVDGARLSGAKVHRYAHLDSKQLSSLLSNQSLANKTNSKNIIVSDGVFSMDGDCADVLSLLNSAEEHDALLVIDDAHGTGTVGKDGKGLIQQAGIAGHARLLEVGTLGKAFGGYGAYILGSNEMIDGLRQRMRTFIYSTALPVAVIAGAFEALNIIKQGDLVQKLQSNVDFFIKNAKHLTLLPSNTPIQPLMLGTDEHALNMAKQLRGLGYFVPAIRPPTVPEGQSRLRITLSAEHSENDILALIEVLQGLSQE
ncbi:MAG: 8-amino-7-oxononanoate synthase [Ghiorsea sp.]